MTTSPGEIREHISGLGHSQKAYLKRRLELEKEVRRTAWLCSTPDKGPNAYPATCKGRPHVHMPTRHARPNQRPPWKANDGKPEWLLMAGRGFGKTRVGAETTRVRVNRGLAGRVALVGRTAADVRDVMLEGESGLLSVFPKWQRPTYQPSKRRVIFHNGAVGFAYSSDDPDILRGPQHDFIWGDEVSTWRHLAELLANARMGLRLGDDPRALWTGTPRTTVAMKALVEFIQTHGYLTSGRTYDNIGNLASIFKDTVIAQYEGTRLGRQELEGILLDDVEGALWNWAMFEWAGFRLPYTDALRDSMTHVVVAVDPAVTATKDSDMTGIAVIGKKGEHAYVMHSEGARTTPNASLQRAISLYHTYHADRIVGEVNNGGDFIESLLRTHDKRIPFRKIRASRGKIARAEPVVALYEQERVHHVGSPESHALLEGQQTTYTGERGDDFDSPDVMDAVVWGVSDLMLKRSREIPPAQGIST